MVLNNVWVWVRAAAEKERAVVDADKAAAVHEESAELLAELRERYSLLRRESLHAPGAGPAFIGIPTDTMRSVDAAGVESRVLAAPTSTWSSRYSSWLPDAARAVT